jgi:hypothetical protein
LLLPWNKEVQVKARQRILTLLPHLLNSEIVAAVQSKKNVAIVIILIIAPMVTASEVNSEYDVNSDDDDDEGYYSVADSDVSSEEENTSTFLVLIHDAHSSTESEAESSDGEDNNLYRKHYQSVRPVYKPLEKRSLSAQYTHITNNKN